MWHSNRKHGDIFSEVPKLGPSVTSSPPDPDKTPGPPLELDVSDNLNVNSRYVLSGPQRDAVKTHSVKGNSDRNNTILKKRDLLPERIQHLIYDITLLYSSPYISVDRWEEGLIERKDVRSRYSVAHQIAESSEKSFSEALASVKDQEVEYYESPYDSPAELWQKIIEVTQVNQHIRGDLFYFDSNPSREAQFGFEIGSLFRMLRPEYEEQLPGFELIWGFILAFIGQPRQRVDSREVELLEELVAQLEDRHELRRKDADRMASPDEISERGEPYDELTKQGVEQAGITPHPIVLREVAYHQMTTSEDGDLHRKTARRVAKDMKEIVPLEEVDQIADKISGDIEVIKTRGKMGLKPAQKVLKVLWEWETGQLSRDDDDSDQSHQFGSSATSDMIAAYLNVKPGPVSGVLNNVSTEEKYETWTEEPLVVKDEGGRGTEWECTPYGAVVCNTAFEREEEVSWLYRYAIGPEELSLFERKLITDALDSSGLIKF